MNLQTDLEKRINVKEDYDKIAVQYGKEFGNYIEDTDVYDEFIKYVRPNGLIVDLGAGTGRSYSYFNNQKFKYIGLDFSSNMRNEAYKIHGAFNYILDDMVNIKNHFSNNSVDAFFAVYSLFHIPKENLKQLFIDINHILIDNGIFIFSYQNGTGEELVDEPYLGDNGKNVLYMSYVNSDFVKDLVLESCFEIIYTKDKVETEENAINSNDSITSFVIVRKIRNV